MSRSKSETQTQIELLNRFRIVNENRRVFKILIEFRSQKCENEQLRLKNDFELAKIDFQYHGHLYAKKKFQFINNSSILYYLLICMLIGITNSYTKRVQLTV